MTDKEGFINLYTISDNEIGTKSLGQGEEGVSQQGWLAYLLPIRIICVLKVFANRGQVRIVKDKMKGSPCCAGLMRSCLHTYRTKTNLTQHIIQPWGGIRQVWGGHQSSMGGSSAKYGGAISQVWGGHQPTMGGAISQVWGGIYFPTSMYRKSKSTELL